MRPAPDGAGPTLVELTESARPVPTLGLDEAVERIGAVGEPFVLFENAETGRGNVIYRRYDGHYGLIAPD
jgi:hypothetical protein